MHVNPSAHRPLSLVIALLASLLLLPATASSQDAEPAAQATAKVRFLHGAAAGPMDFYVGDQLAVPGLEFGELSRYVAVRAGKPQLESVGSEFGLGEGRDSTSQPDSLTGYAETIAKLRRGSTSTVVLVTDETGSNELHIIRDKARPRAGKSVVRIVNLCSDCGPVDFALDGTTEPLATSLDFHDAVASTYARVKPGELDLEMRVAGQPDLVADLDPVRAVRHSNATLYAVGRVVDDSLALVPALDAALTKVRVANSGAQDQDVDVYIGGWKAAEGLRPRRAARFAGLRSGFYRVQVVEAGGKIDEATVSEGVVSLEPGATSAVVVADADPIYVAPVPNSPKKAAKVSRMRFANVSPNLPSFDVYVDDVRVAEGLGFGEWSGYVGKADGEGSIQLRIPETGAADKIGSMRFMAPETSYTAYVAGSLDDGDITLVIVKDRVSKPKK